jgi:branched-chain amino acid transport system permease protein
MRQVALCLAALLLTALVGCGTSLDRSQYELCRRVIEALLPQQTAVREIRAAAAGPHRVRIDYAAVPSDPGARVKHVACTFAGAPDGLGRSELVAVETEEGALGEARLLFLKRFFLAPLAGAVAAPDAAHVPRIPASAAYAAQQAVSAIVPAAAYGLLACAYSLIYGLVGRINLAFGDIAVLGAYGAIGGVAAAFAVGIAQPAFGVALAFAIATPLAALWSYVSGRFVIAPLHARFRAGQPILIATLAVALCIQEFLRLFQGARERWLPPFLNDPVALLRADGFVVTVTPVQILVGSIALAAALALLLVMVRTAFGRRWRAFSDDPLAATLMGIDPARVMGSTFVLAGLNAGLAGWIVAVYYGNVSFSLGTILSLKALLAAIAGGIGRLGGALAGGLLIGFVEAAWSAYFDIGSRDIVVFSLLVALFVLRPGGLFGNAGPRLRDI